MGDAKAQADVRKRDPVLVLVAIALVLVAGGLVFDRWVRSLAPAQLPLAESIWRGDLAAVRRYLDSGGSPDAVVEVYGERMSLLKEAIYDRETEIAIVLLNGGADFAASGVTLSEVGANGMTDLVDRLLPGAATNDRLLPGLGRAASAGHFDTVQSYIRFAQGRMTEESLRAFSNAAQSAILPGYDDVARLLFDAGGLPPSILHGVARFSSPGMVRYLLAKGYDPTQIYEADVAGVEERTPLDYAWKNYQDRMAVSQELGAEDTEYLRGRDAEYNLFELLRAGARTDNTELLAVARDGLAEISAAPPDTQLTLAAHIGFIDVVAELLEREAEWSEQAKREAVIAALLSDHDDIARLLLENGAPVDGGVLHAAANASSAGLVRYLLRNGASPTERVDGRTPVEAWLENSNLADPHYVLHELIVGGADVCWLRERGLQGFDASFLRTSAPECWAADVID